MKKRIIPIVLITVFAVVLMLALAACFGGGKKATKQEQALEITVANETLTVRENVIVLSEAGTYRLQKTDFNVTVRYDDDSKEDITEYTFDASGVSYNDPGTYSITFTYKSLISMYTVVIESAPYDELPEIPQDVEKLSVIYSGETVKGLDVIDAAMTGTKLSDLIEDGKVTVDPDTNFTPEATNVGSYQVGFIAASGYGWTVNGMKQTTMTTCWEIHKCPVPVPTLKEGATTTFVYDGTPKTLDLELNGFDNILSFNNGGETRTATEVNEAYTCQALIKSEYQENYAFLVNGELYPYTVVEVATWSITRKEIPIPTPTGYTKITEFNAATYYHYDYTGDYIDLGFDLSDYPELKITDADQIKRVLRDGQFFNYYIVTIGPNDEIVTNNATGNYKWTGYGDFPELSFYIYVDPVDFVVPNAVSSATLEASGLYGSVDSYDVNLYYGENNQSGIGLTAATKALLEDNGMLPDLTDYINANGTSLVYVGDPVQAYSAGTEVLPYWLTIPNYNPISLNITVTIAPLQCAVTEVQWASYYNYVNDQSQTVFAEISGDHIYVGQGHFEQVFFEINGSIPMEGDQISYQVRYKVYAGTRSGDDIVYEEQPIQAAVVSSDYGWNTWYWYPQGVVSAAVDVGYYKTVAEFVHNSNYVFTVNGNVVTGLEKEWEIKKNPTTFGCSADGTYGKYATLSDGKTYFSYYTGADKMITAQLTNVNVSVYSSNWSHAISTESVVDLNDYVEILSTTTYVYNKTNQTWDVATDTTAVARYKTVVAARIKAAYADSYTLVEDEWSIEWEILPNEIDLSGVSWDAKGSYVYGEGIPKLVNVPDGVCVDYTGTGAYVTNVGTGYEITAAFSAQPGVDGCDGVTFTNVPAAGDLTKTFDITVKTITAEDFYLKLTFNVSGDETQNLPRNTYEVVNTSEIGTFSESIGSDFSFDAIKVSYVSVPSGWYDYNDGQGNGFWSYTNHGEVGTYTYIAYIYLTEDPNGNYVLAEDSDDPDDEDDAYTMEITEPYVIKTAEKSNGDTATCAVPYNATYGTRILVLTYTWSIVEAE